MFFKIKLIEMKSNGLNCISSASSHSQLTYLLRKYDALSLFCYEYVCKALKDNLHSGGPLSSVVLHSGGPMFLFMIYNL